MMTYKNLLHNNNNLLLFKIKTNFFKIKKVWMKNLQLCLHKNNNISNNNKFYNINHLTFNTKKTIIIYHLVNKEIYPTKKKHKKILTSKIISSHTKNK